jgi:hypothetical protein
MLNLKLAAVTIVGIATLSFGSVQARPLMHQQIPGRTVATGKIDRNAPLPPINPFRLIRTAKIEPAV